MSELKIGGDKAFVLENLEEGHAIPDWWESVCKIPKSTQLTYFGPYEYKDGPEANYLLTEQVGDVRDGQVVVLKLVDTFKPPIFDTVYQHPPVFIWKLADTNP